MKIFSFANNNKINFISNKNAQPQYKRNCVSSPLKNDTFVKSDNKSVSFGKQPPSAKDVLFSRCCDQVKSFKSSDTKLNNYLDHIVAEYNDNIKVLSYIRLASYLQEIYSFTDAVCITNGIYTKSFEGIDYSYCPDFHLYMRILNRQNPKLAAALELRAQQKMNGEKDIENSGETDAKTDPEESLVTEYIKEKSLWALKDYCLKFNNDMSSYLYKTMYLPLEKDKGENVLKLCEEINDRFGTKVFLAEDKTEDIEKSLKYVIEEFDRWQKAGRDKVYFPNVLDFSRLKFEYIREGYCGFASKKAVCLCGNDYKNVQYSLRHEMTHYNDTGLRCRYNEDVLKQEFLENGLVYKFENGMSTLDYVKKNNNEIIALASEGNMAEYSERFKNLLIKCGMPEWMFNLPPKGENVKTYVKSKETLEDLKQQHPDYSVDKIIELLLSK